MEVLLKRHTLTVDQYHQMFDIGIITEKDKVELIKGEIITMSPKGSQHSYYINLLNQLFGRLLGEEAIISIQNPIQLDSLSEPEPDIVLCIPPMTRYKDHHPTSQEVLLVVEVAHSSLEYDQQVKLPLYAEAGISEVWIVDVLNQRIHINRNPKAGQYHSKETFSSSDSFMFQVGDKSYSLTVDQILG